MGSEMCIRDRPKGVVNIVSGGVEAGEALTSHKSIGKILFTGGSATGSHVIKNSSNKIGSRQT